MTNASWDIDCGASAPLCIGSLKAARQSRAKVFDPKAALKRRSLKGFTLTEALAAVVLISVGLVAGGQCLGALAANRARAMDTEEMQRLAFRKYDEILAEGSLPGGQTSGDFDELGENRFVWHADRTSTGTGNLDVLRVQVTRDGQIDDRPVEAQGLVCRPKKGSS